MDDSPLTPEDAKNLIVFLSRADLKGHEAPILVQLTAKLLAIQNRPALAPPGADINAP